MFLTSQERNETIWACRFCMMCHVADRAASIVRRESYYPRGRAAILWGLEQGFLEWNEEIADIMYTTLNDGLLEKWCVGNYNHEELVVDTRARLFEKGLTPEEVRRFVERLHADHEPGPSASDILSQAGVETDPDAEVLLFCGCTARSRQAETVRNMGRLFNRAGVRFKVLDQEPCCGWPLYQVGDFTGAGEFSVRIARMIKDANVSQVVVLDADCFRMFTTRTRSFGGDIAGVLFHHVTQVLDNWLTEGNLKVAKKISGAVTYHDPCALARYCEELEAPRSVLSAILEEDLREMDTHGKMANCCGAGGFLPVFKPELSRETASLRLREAEETGAALMVTACTRCDEALGNAQSNDSAGGKLAIRNLVDLVARAVCV